MAFDLKKMFGKKDAADSPPDAVSAEPADGSSGVDPSEATTVAPEGMNVAAANADSSANSKVPFASLFARFKRNGTKKDGAKKDKAEQPQSATPPGSAHGSSAAGPESLELDNVEKILLAVGVVGVICVVGFVVLRLVTIGAI